MIEMNSMVLKQGVLVLRTAEGDASTAEHEIMQLNPTIMLLCLVVRLQFHRDIVRKRSFASAVVEESPLGCSSCRKELR